MTYFTGNVKYETQGLLSPRKDTETVSRLNQLEFLRFVAVMHYIAYIHFDVPNLPEDNTWHWWRKNLKHWCVPPLAPQAASPPLGLHA